MKNCDYSVDPDGTAWITLQRTRTNNALDGEMIRRIRGFIAAAGANPGVRQLVLQASGSHFCSGMDLKWLQSGARESDLSRLAGLMRSLYTLECPTLALVRGGAWGGGAGLIACCDLVLASTGVRFCFPEVRLGLVPAVISPYVVRAIGARQARRYFLTGDAFDAAEALRLGLVHIVDTDANLETRLAHCIASLQAAGPDALKQTRQLLDRMNLDPADPATSRATARWLNSIRATAEAREGLLAFRQKRQPGWRRLS